MHNFVFQGGGVGGVGGLFSGILRCEFNRFEFNKFPPPPNKATHGLWNWQQLELFVIVYQMLLAAVFVILKLFQNNLPSFASTWQVVVWQRLVVSCMVMWNTDKVFNCPLPQPVIKQCFLKSTCKITFHESFMAWFTFF